MTSTQDVYFEHNELYLHISHIEQENNINNDFIENLHTFISFNYLSTFYTSFSGVSTILINKDF